MGVWHLHRGGSAKIAQGCPCLHPSPAHPPVFSLLSSRSETWFAWLQVVATDQEFYKHSKAPPPRRISPSCPRTRAWAFVGGGLNFTHLVPYQPPPMNIFFCQPTFFSPRQARQLWLPNSLGSFHGGVSFPERG